MTTAVAKQLISDLLDAGANITVISRGANDWLVRATSTGGPVDAKQIATLANRYSVSSQTNQADFV